MKRKPKAETLSPVVRYRNDSHGRQRRLCDEITTTRTGFSKGDQGDPCSHYMHREIDGRAVCQWHDPDRNANRIMCEHVRSVDGVFTRCGFRARWHADGRWWCTTHDPKRDRCEDARAHPAIAEMVAVLGAEMLPGGPMISPTAPTAVGKFAKGMAVLRLCSDCARGLRPEADPFALPRSVRVPCCLCGGTCCLYDDDERPFPCVCTPGGRQLVNGVPDAVVLARLEGDG